MTLSISEVKTRRELKNFIKFPMRLYAENKCYVPPLISFEMSTLDWEKNPAFEHSRAKYWLVKNDKEIVGRVAGIIIDRELEDTKSARFGWIDFVDNLEVSKLLLDTVTEWALANGAERLHGPLGFTDLDFMGALVEGFEFMATQASIYNEPYYIDHYEKHGLLKAVDWTEARGEVPQESSKRLDRMASLSKSRFGLKTKTFKNNKEILKYGPAAFRLINKTYSDLYGYYPLTEKQIAYFTDQYFGFIRKDFISMVVNKNDELIALAICIPSISKGLRKAKGHLFPFGFIYILRDYYANKDMDLFLIGVDQEYQKLGAPAIIFSDLINSFITKGVKRIATGPILEDNTQAQNLWLEFEHKKKGVLRRRCYQKNIH